jgi:hypothetical protein
MQQKTQINKSKKSVGRVDRIIEELVDAIRKEKMSDVVRLDPSDPKATVCGTCNRAWDDSISTSLTPTPAGRCPFEYEHESE